MVTISIFIMNMMIIVMIMMIISVFITMKDHIEKRKRILLTKTGTEKGISVVESNLIHNHSYYRSVYTLLCTVCIHIFLQKLYHLISTCFLYKKKKKNTFRQLSYFHITKIPCDSRLLRGPPNRVFMFFKSFRT